MAELSPVKIKKIFEAGKLIYPATILDAVKDATEKITVNGVEVANPTYGKTVREIIVDNEKVTAAALNDHETRMAALESADASAVTADKIAAWDKAVTDATKALADAATADGKAVDAQSAADAAQADATSALEAIGDSTSGLVKDVADLKAAVGEGSDLDTRLDALEATVGDSASGLVKDVADNAQAIADEETARKAQIGDLGKQAVAADAPEGTVAADHTVKSYVDAAIAGVTSDASTLEGRVKANEDAIALLNDDDQTEGSVKYQVATEIAKIVNDNNNGSIDTLNEIAAWIVNDQTGAAKMNADIVGLQNTVGDESKGLVKDVNDLQALIGDDSVADQVAAEKTRAEGVEGGLQDSIDAINNETTGILANAKSYADSLVKDAEGNSLFDAAGDADQALVDAKAYAEGLLKDGENDKYALAGHNHDDVYSKLDHNHDDAYASKDYEGKVDTLEGLVGETSVADQITAELAKVKVDANASDAVKGITVTVNQSNGVVAKPVVNVTAATVTYTAGTATQDANLEASANSGNVLDSSAIAAIKNYVDNHFSSEACTDTNDYADVF